MPDDNELFPGGEPPERDELLRYLVHTVGLDTDDAREVVARYPDPSVGYGAGNVTLETPERLRTWLDAQPEVRAVSGPGGVGRVVGREVGTMAQPVLPIEDDRDPDSARVARAAQAADEATQRARGRRDRFYRAAAAVGFDSGPGVDAAALAQSMAVGVFTDAAGNPVIDPETGMPTEVNAATLWQAIKGETFDMGALAIPRAPTPRRRPRAGREGADDARLARIEQVAEERRRFVTPSMAMALLSNMDDDDVIKLQQQLWEAGLFGDTPPSWGIADQATRTAYMELFGQASLTPDESIDRVLERLKDEAITRGTAGGTTQSEVPAFKPEVASAESLNALIDDIAQDLLGRFATDEEKSRLVSQLQTKELDTQKAQYERDVAAATGGGTGTTGAPGGIDAFMQAIAAQESGGSYTAENPSGAYGKFQIMPSNWPSWSERAGLGRNAPRTPENQEIVARHVMMEYYQRFGNWRDVAIAWFAGPGAVGSANAERRSDGNLTVRQYADRAMARMAEISSGGGGMGTGVGQQFGAVEVFDPAAEAEAALKASDPAGWMGHQFADRAVEFYQLLGGLA